MDRYVLLHDIEKVATRMDGIINDLSGEPLAPDELQRRVKYIAAAIGDVAKIIKDVIEASDIETLDFELTPELTEPSA